MAYTIKDLLRHSDYVFDHGPGFIVGLVVGFVLGGLSAGFFF